MAATKIKHVYGNVMRLAIPLTLRTRMLINSVETESDTDFTDYKGEVIVRLYEKNRERRFVASMSGNVATIEDDGTTPIGTYNVEVLCRNTHDEPMRFMGRFLVQIVDATADAGIDPGIEFDAVTYALEGAIFLYAKGDKGDDGVGIEDIEVEQNASPNGANIVNILLTDGRVYTFQVRNGYGGTSGIIVNGALHTQRADGAIDIGTVIRSHQNLSNYVSESEFNTWIQSYYTKTQADNLLANKASTASVERITPYEVTFTTGNNSNIVCNHTIANIYQNYQSHKPIIGKFGESVGTLVYIKGGENPEAAFLFGDRYDSPYLLRYGISGWAKEDLVDQSTTIEIDSNPEENSENAVSSGGVWYALTQKVSSVTINGTTQTPDEDGDVSFTVEGGSGGYEPPVGGIPKTDLASGVQSSLDAADSAYQKPSGGIPSTDMTSAVQTSLGKADTAYQKPSGGIPASDLEGNIPANKLSQDVQTSLGKANTALQQSDKTSLQGAIDAVQTALDGKVDKETGKSLMTDAERTKLQNLPTADQLTTQLGQKANDADVVKSVTINGELKTPQSGNVNIQAVKSVTINGTTTPVDNNGNVNLGTIHDGVDGTTPHIGQDGYWYIGTTKTDTKAQGERGNDGVSSADECVVVNNLDGDPADLEEGQVAVLGADQGKELKMAIDNKGVSFEVKGDTLFIRTASSPMVNVLPTSIQFDDTIFSNTRTATVHIYGRNLTSQVDVQVSGVGFSGSTTILPDIDGKVDEDVTITFAPTASTGTEEEDGNSYEGSVNVECDGAESVSATLEGFGVLTITPRITASIDKAALKGVLDTTADGAYTSEPATATLHVQASNINQVLTLAVDNAKFALSESQISVEDALRGKDITVTYLRQSAVTAEDDECTITITATHDSTSVQSTIDVSGATGAKITSGTIGTFDGITYSYDGSDVACKKSSSTPIELVIPAYFYDGYGYKYTPVAFNTKAFTSSAIRSLVAGSNISKVFTSAFSSCTSLKTAVFKSWPTMRDSVFIGCTALESVDFTSINFSSRNNIFSGCTKLASVTVRSSSKVTINNNSHFTKATLTIGGEEKEVFYYVDSDGNNQQKKLYVPSALVSSYQQDAIWGMFDVQPISE